MPGHPASDTSGRKETATLLSTARVQEPRLGANRPRSGGRRLPVGRAAPLRSADGTAPLTLSGVAVGDTGPSRAAPVFVDHSGRRWRHVRRLARVVRVCLLVYFLLVVGSFARLSFVPRLSLPGLGNLLPPTVPRGLAPLGVDVLSTPAPGRDAP